MAYATAADLTSIISSRYTVPSDADALLQKASDLIDFVTNGRSNAALANTAADLIYVTDFEDLATALKYAACYQVEFWQEVGEEHDVAGLHGSLTAGKVQMSIQAGILAPRARRILLNAGLLWLGVPGR